MIGTGGPCCLRCMRLNLIDPHPSLPFQVAGDQDLFVVDGVSGHQLVLDLEPLSGQRNRCRARERVAFT